MSKRSANEGTDSWLNLYGQWHEILSGWNPIPAECCGRWSPNGRWYVFQSTRDGRTDLWALPEPSGLIDREPREPIQLTAGPISSLAPEMSPYGRKLYMVGQQLRGELDRYDARLKQFVPYLNGVSAEFLDFSRDGKWITYVSFPDHLLWRCDVQGDHCLQLTGPAMQPTAPRWSPDSTRIAFFDASSGKPFNLFLVPANGGSPLAVVDETWNEIDPIRENSRVGRQDRGRGGPDRGAANGVSQRGQDRSHARQ